MFQTHEEEVTIAKVPIVDQLTNHILLVMDKLRCLDETQYNSYHLAKSLKMVVGDDQIEAERHVSMTDYIQTVLQSGASLIQLNQVKRFSVGM